MTRDHPCRKRQATIRRPKRGTESRRRAKMCGSIGSAQTSKFRSVREWTEAIGLCEFGRTMTLTPAEVKLLGASNEGQFPSTALRIQQRTIRSTAGAGAQS